MSVNVVINGKLFAASSLKVRKLWQRKQSQRKEM